MRVVKLSSDPDTEVKDFWVVYDRSLDDAYGNSYAFGAIINVTVDAKDRQQRAMAQASYEFKIQSEQQKNNGKKENC